MSKVNKCDICGKVFDYGFLIEVSTQGGHSFTNIAEDRFEIGKKDICKSCYYKAKKQFVAKEDTENANPAN